MAGSNVQSCITLLVFHIHTRTLRGEGRREGKVRGRKEKMRKRKKEDRDGVRKTIKVTRNAYKVDRTLMLSIAYGYYVLQWHGLIDAHHG